MSVQDAYQEYIEERRARGPMPEPVAVIELTSLQLTMLAMFVSNQSNVVRIPDGFSQDAAREAWDDLIQKLVHTKIHE